MRSRGFPWLHWGLQGKLRLTYHVIAPFSSDDPLITSQEEFLRHIEFLRIHFPGKYEIHFDDGFVNNWWAFERLSAVDEPHIFVCTDLVGTDHRFSWAASEKLADWSMIQYLPSWITVGAHERKHRNICEVSDLMISARQEKLLLEEKLNRPVKKFAIPFGDPGKYSQGKVEEIKLAGFSQVFSNHMTLIPNTAIARMNIGGLRATHFEKFLSGVRPFWWAFKKS